MIRGNLFKFVDMSILEPTIQDIEKISANIRPILVKLLTLLFIVPFFSFSQETDNSEFEFYEAFGHQRVYINKTVKSYNFTISKYVNNVEVDEQTEIDIKMKNPSSIEILSNENNVIIRINNKKLREDFVLKFRRIYKSKEKLGDFYTFVGKSNSCNASYIIPQNDMNQILFIDCLDDSKSGYSIDYTISKFEQL